ncbi:MAG: MBL fold metallo-hydrolase [Nitriliruptoraceae bacterium]
MTLQLHILGGGTPQPTPDMFGTAYLLEIDDNRVMFDCGPAATQKLVRAGVHPRDVDWMFFTHHHFDHDIDYPCFLLTRWDSDVGDLERLHVRGPTLTEEMTRQLVGRGGVYEPDIRSRIEGPHSQRGFASRGGVLPRPWPVTDAMDIAAGAVVEGPAWQVRSGHAAHVQPWLDSLAYRLEAAGGHIVFTGDTEPCDEVVALAQGADAMVCMCWDHQDAVDKKGSHPGQCGTVGAARMARDAEVPQLILAHRSPSVVGHATEERAREDIASVYDGDVVFAQESDVIDI